MPQVVIIAGPNGAGKTTFASTYLVGRHARFAFVNADEIAHAAGRRHSPGESEDIQAARIMLERIDNLVAAGADFAFETTLATLSYGQKISVWRRSGYVATLIYLRLPSIETSIERVRRRVLAGGHGIPEEIIRRRFDKSSAYFNNLYKPLVDKWYVFESVEGEFVQAESWDQNETDI